MKRTNRARAFLSTGVTVFVIAMSAFPVFGAEVEKRPNVLFCIADDASYPHMGAYGCSWVNTPSFDRVAKEGLLFNRAYTPNAKCAPSRACILTGRNSWQLEQAANHGGVFPLHFKSYPEALAESGYFVGMTTKGWAPGLALDSQGNRRHLAGKPFDKKRAKPPTTGISNADYAGNFEDFLDARPSDAPWCFWYGSVEPHRAYEYGSGVAKGGKTTADIDRVPAFWPDNEVIRNDLLDYAYEIEHFDSHLGRMLDLLEKRGELENTIVVVTADNGMPFPRIKGQVYEMSNHLPLAIMWKRGIQSPGRKIDDYVSFIDFAPTFLEVAGVSWDKSGMKPASGRSLTSLFRSDRSGQVDPARDHVLIGKERHDIGRPNDVGYPVRGIVKDNVLYLKNYETARWPAGNPETGYLNTDASPTKTQILQGRRSGEDVPRWSQAFGKRPAEEMFDLATDPDCVTNVAADPKYQGLKQQMAEQMTAELNEQEDPRMAGRGYLFDEYEYADPRTRGFYERFFSGEKVRAGWVNENDFEKQKLD